MRSVAPVLLPTRRFCSVLLQVRVFVSAAPCMGIKDAFTLAITVTLLT